MSNATQPMIPQDNSSSKYGIILYVTVLGVIVIVSFISIIWKRMRLSSRLGWSEPTQGNRDYDGYRSSDLDHDTIIGMENGVSEATLDKSYPKFLCSEAHKVVHGDKVGVLTATLCCSICLGEYMDAEMLRLLPSCGHLFHQKCIDHWLRLHSTCPLCRTYSLPNTPLNESTPLTSTPES